MFIMLSGKPPFGGKTNKDIINNVLNGTYNMKSDVWNNVSNSNSGDGRFLNSWTNADPTFLTIQRVQYSNVKGCSVKLRGGITRTKRWDGTAFVVFILPFGFRPLRTRWFHATIDSGGSGLLPVTILIRSTGEVEIATDPFTLGFVTSSFDGIEFEIN